MLKRLFKLICFGVPLMLLQAHSARAQVLLDENFDYAAGQLITVSGGSWVNIGGTLPIQVTAGSLSYTGYPSANIGNKTTINASTSSSQDAYRQFTTQVPDGNVYVSFLLKITSDTMAPDTSTNGDYFIALLPSTSTTVYVGRIMIKAGSVAGKFKLGLKAASTNPTGWLVPEYDVNTTYLVVLCYNLVTGNTNDVVKMWINPVISAVEPAADLSQTTASATADPADIARIAIRQGYTSAASLITPDADIDGIRVGKTWSDITGITPSNPSVLSTSPVSNATNVLPDAVIQVAFDRLMDVTTIDTASFAVSGVKQSRYYPDSIRPSANSTSYIFYVQDSLRHSDTVTVTLSTAMADTAGNHLLTPFAWIFYTSVPETMKPYLVSSSPADGAGRIAVNSGVVLTFNEALLPASVDTSAFELLGVKNPKYSIDPPVLSAGNTVVTLTPVDSLYYGDTITVHLKPVIADISGNTLRDTSVSFNTRLTPDLTIYDIQYTTNLNGESAYKNQIVTFVGVVTAGTAEFGRSYFVQNGTGPWSGMYVYDTRDAVIGDSVRITGLVSEYKGPTTSQWAYTMTEITGVTEYTILKSNCTPPPPTVVPTGSVATTAATSESYESVLVEVRNVVVTNDSLGYYEWGVNDGSGTCRVDDMVPYAAIGYTPNTGDSLIHVRGILNYSFDDFKIEPRMMGDVMDNKPVKIAATIPSANNTNVPTAASIQVNFNKPMRSYTVIPSNFALSGNLSGLISFNVVYDTTNWSCHLIPAQSFAPGESIKVTAYHALLDSFDRSLDGNGDGLSTADSTDDYSFRFITLIGGVPIGDVQKPGPDGFSSNLVNQTVLIEGVVTGPDLYFTYPGNTTASWYLQDGTGGVNVYGGDINTFELGMRVVVEGMVTEYSGVTEISDTKISIWNKAQTLPAAKEMIYNQFPTEAVEGLLISFTGAISSPPSYAGGGYNMDVRNGNSPVAIRFSENAGFDLTKLTLGTKVRVTGIVSQYDKDIPYSSGYQIVPRFPDPYVYNGTQYPADIELLTDAVLPSSSAQITAIEKNPFSPDQGEVANIEINAPSADHLTLRLYDLKGRLVKTLLNNTMGGHQIVPWDGTDQMNRRVNIGIYIVHLRCVAADGKTTDQTKLLVMGTKLK